MARTNATDVKEIMDNCTLDDSVVDSFIDTANLLITKVYENDTTLGADYLEEIEKYFTAHMLASTLCRTTSDEKLGDASVKYTGKWDKNLESTPYGQLVKQLDCTGLMSNIGKKAATIRAITSFE